MGFSDVAGGRSRRIDEPATVAPQAPNTELSAENRCATGSHAPVHMVRQVKRFNSQLESFAEVAMVLVVGVLLATVKFRVEVLWFVPLLLLVIRPVSVAVGLLGTGVRPVHRRLMAWFGNRGIGSLY